MAISRWAICLALSLACWLMLALAVWAQAPSRLVFSPFAPRTNSTGTKPAARPAPPAAEAQPPTNDPLVKWQLLGRSAEGRAIEYVQFGAGDHQVLVIGALRGNEPEGVAQAQSLASHLARFPRRLEDVTITIVRDPNPDGRARRISGNARGAELNRNFLAARQTGAGPASPAAAQPGSEPETIALVELLHDVKPERVILFGTSSSRGTVTFTGPAGPLAAQVALEAGTQANPLDTSAAPGALLTLTGINLGIPSLEIATIPRATADAVWSQQKRAIMTAVGCGTPMPFVSVPNQPRRPKPAAAYSAAQPAAAPMGYANPAGPVPAAARGQATAQAAANAPQVLNFSELRFGRPTVQVQSPRTVRMRRESGSAVLTNPWGGPAPADIAPAANGFAKPAAPGFDPRVQRLPPVQHYQPDRREFSRDQALPQRPIPVYPTTGQ
jgi:hypothetical protein